MYGEMEFSCDVISKFGASAPGLAENAGMLHTQMSFLAELVRERGPCRQEIFGFLEALLEQKDTISEIENAVAISFIELPELPGLGIEGKVPPRVLRVLEEQDARWKKASVRA